MTIIMKIDNQQEECSILKEWETKSKLLRRRFPQLTVSDLQIENNDENNLLEKIEKRLNKKRSEVIEIIKKTLFNKFITNLKIQYHE